MSDRSADHATGGALAGLEGAYLAERNYSAEACRSRSVRSCLVSDCSSANYWQHFHTLGLPLCPLRRAARVKKKMSDTRRRAESVASARCTGAPCWHAASRSTQAAHAAQTDAAGATPGVRLDPTVRTARTAAADRPMAEHRHATTTTTAAAAFTCVTIQALLGLDAAAEAALARESDGGCRHLLRIWRDGLNERRLRASCAQALDRARGCARAAPAPAADPALAPPVLLALPLALARCVRRRPACTTSPGPEPDPERTPL